MKNLNIVISATTTNIQNPKNKNTMYHSIISFDAFAVFTVSKLEELPLAETLLAFMIILI